MSTRPRRRRRRRCHPPEAPRPPLPRWRDDRRPPRREVRRGRLPSAGRRWTTSLSRGGQVRPMTLGPAGIPRRDGAQSRAVTGGRDRAAMTAADARAAMVRRLRSAGIVDPRVLAAMRDLPRERFVPGPLAHAAYDDWPLPIGLGQTISAPWIVAFSTAALGLGPDADVLEIGTGSGYGAAVLARCHRSVVTIARHPQLAERAK